jgi:hypothetical protein
MNNKQDKSKKVYIMFYHSFREELSTCFLKIWQLVLLISEQIQFLQHKLSKDRITGQES